MSEAAKYLRELSEPRPSGEFVKVAIDRAAKLCGLHYWRAFDIWYRKARRVEEYEIDAIKEALRIKNERAARNELQELRLRLTRLESLLATSDAEFHSATIDHARAQIRGFGGLDSAMARKR